MSTDPITALGSLPGVAEASAAARDAVDRLLGHRLLRRRSAEVSAEAALRSARASAALDGSDLDLLTLRRAGSADPVLQGALRVAAALGEIATLTGRAPLQAIARLHTLAAADLLPADLLGRPAEGGAATSARLAGLAGLLAAPVTGSALLLAAVAHGELLTVAPFSRGGGVVARGLARAVLVDRGFDPKAVCPLDVGHAADPDAYQAAAEAYAGGDVTPWLLHCAGAAEAGAREGLAICESLLRADAG